MVYVEANGISTPTEINNMGILLSQLKKQGTVRGRRWVIKRNSKNNIEEVKLIYDPKQYETFEKSKPMVGDRKLIEILETEREKNVL